MNGIDARPLTFEKVKGQETAKRLLTATLKTGLVSRAYLMSGAWSVGKTTLSEIFARSLLCKHRDPVTMSPCNKCPSCQNFLRNTHPSYIEVDAANFGTKENMSNILSMLDFECGDGFRVIFMDEVHRISTAGKDALLKRLEASVSEDSTIFIFSTNELTKMPNTLKSRCTLIPLERPSNEDVFSKLVEMCNEEGLRYDRHALKRLAVWSQGHFRDAENALNPLILMGGIDSANVSAYTSNNEEGTCELLLALEGDLSKALNKAEDLSSRYGSDTIHASIIGVLLDAIHYGLSGMTLDVPEYIKALYNGYGSRMGALLSYFNGRSRITDGKLLQADLVHAHYRFIKGDLDVGKMSFSSGNLTAASSVSPKNPGSKESLNGLMSAAEQRALKASVRKNTSKVDSFNEEISKEWGPEEVADVVSLKRS